ncbi:MAG TPA: GAF domain-containing protein [Chthonomonadaceae bacterium]|nr:GAF domain-containing protein [Chthonomonadaceae bacterium]
MPDKNMRNDSPANAIAMPVPDRSGRSEAESARLADHFRLLLESAGEGIYSVDRQGRCTFINQTAAQMLGYKSQELLGQDMHALTHHSRPDGSPYPQQECPVWRAFQTGQGCQGDTEVLWRRDGTSFPVEYTCRPIVEDGEIRGTIVIFADITERKRTNKALTELQAAEEGRSLVMETARRVALDILSSQTGVEALRHIAEAARTLSGARYAALGVARPDGQGLLEFATVGLTPEEEAAIGPRPRGVGVLGLLLKRTEPLRIDRLGDHPASAGFPPNHPPMESFLGVPIRRGDTVLGSLYLTNKEGGGPFTEADEIAVQALGDYAAVAIHNLHMISRQRALVSGLIAAQEEERRAVAYDLHDGLTQFVMASHAHLEAFRRAYAAGNQAKAAREVEQGLQYLKEAVVESRRLVNGLRSLALDEMGLAGALEQLLAEEKQRAGWQSADLIHNIAGQRFDKTLETAVYRVAQEALTNTRKHAQAAAVRVLLLLQKEERPRAAQLVLEVRDWGCGFVPEEKIGENGRVGLQGMSERVSLMGGTYELHSAPDAGTTIRAVFPVLASPPQSKEGDDR